MLREVINNTREMKTKLLAAGECDAKLMKMKNVCNPSLHAFDGDIEVFYEFLKGNFFREKSFTR